MPKTIQLEVFSFSELSDEAKQKAIHRYQLNELHGLDEIVETLKAFSNEFSKFRLNNWSFDYNGLNYDVSFTDEQIESLAGKRLSAYLQNNHYDLLYKRKQIRKENSAYSATYYESKIQFIETDCPLTGVCYDADILDELRKFIKKPDNRSFYDLITDCFFNLSKTIIAEYDYHNSEEYLIQTCEINEYQFTENGVMV